MNEKALQQLYVLAQGDGYSKTFDDFKKLLSEDEKALTTMYGLAQSDGYSKDVEQFKTLVGFGGAVGGDTMVNEAVEQVKKKTNPKVWYPKSSHFRILRNPLLLLPNQTLYRKMVLR